MHTPITDQQYIIETIRRLRHKPGPLPGGIRAHEGVNFSALCGVVKKYKLIPEQEFRMLLNNMLDHQAIMLIGRREEHVLGAKYTPPSQAGLITSIHEQFDFSGDGRLFLNFTGGFIKPRYDWKASYKILWPTTEKCSYYLVRHEKVYVTGDTLPTVAQNDAKQGTIFPLQCETATL